MTTSFLAASLFLATVPFELSPAGDGGSYLLRVHNRAVHPVPAQVGVAGAPGPSIEIPGYQSTDFLLQCVDGHEGPPPKLVLHLDGEPHAIDAVGALGFPDGLPVVWITAELRGRAQLAKLIADVDGGAEPPIRLVAPTSAPSGFAALRFSRLILLDGGDWIALDEAQKGAVLDAVTWGTPLVVATGDGVGEHDALAGIVPIRLGEVAQPGRALALAAPRARGRRGLTWLGEIPPNARRIDADGAPVLIDVPLGLGRARILAIRVGELAPGALADVAFGPGADAYSALAAWASQRPSLSQRGALLLAPQVWVLLAALVFPALLARRWPRTAAVAGLAVLGAAAAASPLRTDLDVTRAQSLLIDSGTDRTLAFGSFDLELGRGGGRALPAPTGVRLSLEDAQPVGACLVVSGAESWWLTDADPGDRQRLTWYGFGDRDIDVGPPDGALPAFPEGLLAGAELAAIPGGVPVPVEASDRLATAHLARFQVRGASRIMDLPDPGEGSD